MASYTDSAEEGRGRRDLSVAVAFLVLSLVVLYLPADFQNQLAGTLRGTVLRPFILMREAVVQAQVSAQDAVALQARLDSLAGELISQGRRPSWASGTPGAHARDVCRRQRDPARDGGIGEHLPP